MRLALVIVAGLAGCKDSSSSTTTTTGGGPQTLQPALQVSDTVGDWNRGSTFQLLSRGLVLHITQPSLPKNTILDVLLVSPRGEPVFHQQSPYTTDPDQTMGDDPVMHHPIPVYHAKAIAGGYEITHVVPLLGGPITALPQPDGDWGITARLEGVTGTLTATVTLLNRAP
jgi:hypothetical protein